MTEVFNSFRHHASGQRIHTISAIQSTLATQYPDLCVVSTSHDLIKFAKAGHATAELVQDGPPNLFSRVYDPNLKLSNDDDPHTLLQTGIIFAFYKYSYRGNNYLVFVAEGQNSLIPMPGTNCDRRSYILSKPVEGEVAGKSISKAADELILAAGMFTEKSNEEVWVFDGGTWTKDKSLWIGAQDANFDSIIMPAEMKEGILRDITGFFDAREYYRDFGTPWKRGLIFHGPPGNGKTMTLRAVMRKLMMRPEPIPTLYVKTLAQHAGMFSPGPQYSVRQIFQKARQSAPCLLLFEDIDSLVTDDVRTYFLNEVDGLENNDGILMIGSTNNLDKLDLGLSKRPSRFDRKYRFNDPAFEERLSYCEFWRNKLINNPTASMADDTAHRIATLTDGFSFAYIKEAFVGCLLTMVRNTTNVSPGAEGGEKDGHLGSRLEEHVAMLRNEMSEKPKEESPQEPTVAKAKPLIVPGLAAHLASQQRQ